MQLPKHDGKTNTMGDLKPRLVWILNGRKVVGYAKCPDIEWYQKSRSPTIRNLDQWIPFCQLKSGQKRPNFKWSGFLKCWGHNYSNTYGPTL